MLGACTLPWQQLKLPGPVPPEAGPAPIAKANRSPGSPLTPNAPEVAGPQVSVGSGQFTGSPEPRPNPGAANSKDGVTLNFVGASIAEAARSILGDVLGVNYSVSDKVKGSITIQTVRPIPKEALLGIFETMLAGEGAAISVDNGVYRILPANDAISAAAIVARGARRLPGVSAQVVPLRYVAAAEMERIIKSMAPQATILRTDPARNLMVVAGTRGDLDSIMDAVGTFDVDWMRGMSFGLFPIETGDPDAIAQELDTVFANDQDGPTKGLVRFVPNRRLKAILVITSRPEYLKKAQTWVRRLDMVGRATEKEVHVYHIQNRPAVELAQLLQRIYGSQDQGRVASLTRTTTATVSSGGPLPDAVSGGQPPFLPGAPGIPSVAAGPAATGLPAVITPAPTPDVGQPGALPGSARPPLAATIADDRTTGVSIVADESNNALIITATAQEYFRMRRILAQIDVQPNQVLIEATIAEVALNDQLTMGLRWFLQTGNFQFRFTDILATTPNNPVVNVGPTIPAIATPSFPGFSSFFNTPNVQVVLNALSTITDVNIVSSPTLMVLDNKRATLQVGDEVPIVTQSAVAVQVPGAPIVNSVNMRNTGIILNITPRINDGGRVLLDIEQEVSTAVQTTTSGIVSPTIQQRRIKTTVSVDDGNCIVLGGLIQDKSNNTRDQAPLVGDIPILGNLFKHKNDNITRVELLIAITPKIVKDNGQIRAIAAEFRDKINLTTRPQRQAPPDRREQVDRVLR
ncbi:MAG TPA: type II secretion system secretin GspD [Hyphomicrobiaceae bacterium]|nr:type II secretion system secretin GspD [Hyphomicrobiaceae bacterium]